MFISEEDKLYKDAGQANDSFSHLENALGVAWLTNGPHHRVGIVHTCMLSLVEMHSS